MSVENKLIHNAHLNNEYLHSKRTKTFEQFICKTDFENKREPDSTHINVPVMVTRNIYARMR